MKNFGEFLKSFKKENSAIGDLARDFISSRSKAKTYLGILRELNKNNACDGAYKALEAVKVQYKDQQ